MNRAIIYILIIIETYELISLIMGKKVLAGKIYIYPSAQEIVFHIVLIIILMFFLAKSKS